MLTTLDYIEAFYKCNRLHSDLRCKTPIESEREYYSKKIA